MKLYITIIKYGFPVEQEMRQIWDTLEEAKKAHLREGQKKNEKTHHFTN